MPQVREQVQELVQEQELVLLVQELVLRVREQVLVQVLQVREQVQGLLPRA